MPADSSSGEGRRLAAERYKPAKVRLLLVAHAPPASVERYFYFEDVREKDDLFRYVAQGLFGQMPARSEKPAYLERVRDAGVFMIDLVERPYDGSDLAGHVPGLVERCRRLDPEQIVLIKVDVYDAAFAPLRRAGLPVVNERIYFPGQGWQPTFVAGFQRALQSIRWSA